MHPAARALAGLLLACQALACQKRESAPSPPGPEARAPIDGRIDPAPYRAQIEATEALLYTRAQGDEQWKNLSKALLELHNAIVFHDNSALARETSQRLFFFSAQVEAAPSGKHADDQLQVMRGVWEKIRAEQIAAADWFHAPVP